MCDCNEKKDKSKDRACHQYCHADVTSVNQPHSTTHEMAFLRMMKATVVKQDLNRTNPYHMVEQHHNENIQRLRANLESKRSDMKMNRNHSDEIELLSRHTQSQIDAMESEIPNIHLRRRYWDNKQQKHLRQDYERVVAMHKSNQIPIPVNRITHPHQAKKTDLMDAMTEDFGIPLQLLAENATADEIEQHIIQQHLARLQTENEAASSS